ncbi:nuclear pore complex protein Nup133 isoform X2 [Bacillus rossius redtenbacheri]|uniref:nuclear pore complex protein Nup133 isoform X2 n=1 Tax=Bacillus rossius redtenbacheri TaxID=93214 RepID=UPI002FDD2B0F
MDRSFSATGRNLSSLQISTSKNMYRSSLGSRLSSTKKTLGKMNTSGRTSHFPHVICKSVNYVVESFGNELPHPVTEALKFADPHMDKSCTISPNGWAWFVCGLRLVVWQYKRLAGAHPTKDPFYELDLPPSDLAHKADLVSVFLVEGSHYPSCVAVSPEGAVRFWVGVNHTKLHEDDGANLQGQECDRLVGVDPAGCVLATTTGGLVLVSLRVDPDGPVAVTCRLLRPAHGWLGGIGGRVSSFIFGELPSSQLTETKLVKLVAVRDAGRAPDEWQLNVLAEDVLQKWSLSHAGSEKLEYKVHVSTVAREEFLETAFKESCVGGTNEIDVKMLDMQPASDGLLILMSAVNPESRDVHYALGKLNTSSDERPTRFAFFCVLKTISPHRREDDDQAKYQFLIASERVMLYNNQTISIVPAAALGDTPDTVQFISPRDKLLCGAPHEDGAVFFSTLHGLMSVLPSDSMHADQSSINMSFNETFPSDVTATQFSDWGLNFSVTEVNLAELTMNKDSCAQLKAAFIYYIKNRGNMGKSSEILDSVFPLEVEPVIDIDARLDTVVVSVSRELVNDAPSGDPRWAQEDSSVTGIGRVSSLQILHQLEGKRLALEMFITFLKDSKLWNRLSAVTSHGTVRATPYILREHAEKVEAAVALRTLQSSHKIIATGITYMMEEKGARLYNGLSYQDLFYKEVLEVHKLLQVLVKYCQDLATDKLQEMATRVSEVNTVVLSVLKEVNEFRSQRAATFSPASTLSANVREYLPWTAAPGRAGLKDALESLRKLTLKLGLHSHVGAELAQQLVELTDFILDGRKCHLESLRGTDRFVFHLQSYEGDRYNLIKPFLDVEEYEKAAMLAEKYCDFKILIEICEMSGDVERRQRYMQMFSEQGFPQCLFKWHLQEGKAGRLLREFGRPDQPRSVQQALAQFLRPHAHLSWLQHVACGDLARACLAQLQLARAELRSAQRKKIMLASAKLDMLCSDEPESRIEDVVRTIDQEMDLIRYQELLPVSLLESQGFDVDNMRVLTPTEIINLIICDENHNAQDLDFKQAVELLKYVSDDIEVGDLRHKIWCQAVLRDDWVNMDTSSPTSAIQETMFFKLANHMVDSGERPEEFLPQFDRLLEASELDSLRHNSTFQFLLKMCYEHIHQEASEDSSTVAS